MIFNRIEAMLKKCETPETIMPPTQLYNEGWMLRLVLDQFDDLGLCIDAHQLAVPSGCRWYTEALLPPAFPKRSQKDSRAESSTHADGVIGHFDIGKYTKAGLTLKEGATHFVVIEAKMFSGLSKGVKNADYYNQAARTVACMAEAVLISAGRDYEKFKKQLDQIKTIGFFVIAPKIKIENLDFKKYLDKQSVESEDPAHPTSLLGVVKKRAEEYGPEKGKWCSDCFEPMLNRLDIQPISWESVLGLLEPDTDALSPLRTFYYRCEKYNKKRDEDHS